MGSKENMEITGVRVSLLPEEEYPKLAMCSIIIDSCIMITDIKLVDNKHGNFVSMPSIKVRDGYFQDVVFATTVEAREQIDLAVNTAYQKELKKLEVH